MAVGRHTHGSASLVSSSMKVCLCIRLHPWDQARNFCFKVKIVNVTDILSIHIRLTHNYTIFSSRISSPKSLSLWGVSQEPTATFEQIVMIILAALEISGRGVFFLAFPPCLPLVYISVKNYSYFLWGRFDIPPEPWSISSGMTNPTKYQGFVTQGFWIRNPSIYHLRHHCFNPKKKKGFIVNFVRLRNN